MQLLALGLFAFGMDSLAFSQIERSASWRLPTLHDMADTGDAHALILGTGELIGNFTINNVAESQSNFLDNGVPRKNDFTITLGRVDG